MIELFKNVFGKKVDFSEEKIFAMGNQKSGTSAISRLVALRVGEKPPVDIPYFWGDFQSQWRVKEVSLEDAVRSQPTYFRQKFIKEPSLTEYSELLQDIFPNAIFYYIVRNPVDNIRSISDRLQLDASVLRATDTKRDALPDTWVEYMQYHDLSVGSETSLLDRMISRWKQAAQIAISNRDRWLLVKYEDFQADKLAQIDEIVEAISLVPLVDVDNKLNVQYQPKGKGEPLPDPVQQHIREMCAEEMNAFGY